MYTVLFDRIVKNQYSSSTWLREDSLATEFGMSRTPVRTVLRLLAQDGLIELLPKRGARVIPFTVDDLEEAYEIRRSLELLALERGIGTMSIQELMGHRRSVEHLKEESDPAVHAAVDSSLHQFIVGSAKSGRLTSMLASLYRLMQRFRELGFEDREIRERAEAEHLDLIDALISRDGGRASQILSNHIRNSKARILSMVVRTERG